MMHACEAMGNLLLSWQFLKTRRLTFRANDPLSDASLVWKGTSRNLRTNDAGSAMSPSSRTSTCNAFKMSKKNELFEQKHAQSVHFLPQDKERVHVFQHCRRYSDGPVLRWENQHPLCGSSMNG